MQKILAKTLTRRLNASMGKLLHPGQTGFIPKRNTFHNFRCHFNISHTLPGFLKKQLAILSLVAEKAFAQVK